MRWRFWGFLCWVALALGRATWLLAQPAPVPVWPSSMGCAWPADQVCWVVGEVIGVTRQGGHTVRFAFQIEAQALGPNPLRGLSKVPEKPKVWLSWPWAEHRTARPNLHAGERWLLPVRWRPAPDASNEGEFDTRRWMQQQQFTARGTVVGGSPGPWGAQHLGQGKSLMQALRERVRDRIALELGQPRLAALVAALCMGDQNAIEQADWDVFRRTGVAHLVSISGMHVTLLALWLAAAWRWLWCRLSWRGQAWALYWPAPLVALWTALATAMVYAWFSGWGLPAQRTVWMLLATAILRTLNVRWPPHAVWLGLVALVATFDPLALSQPGFWLSYVAVGVLYAMQSGATQGRLGLWFSETIDLQWRITLALAPMSLLFFHGVSLAGGWVNMWAIPWVTWVLTPLSLLGMFMPPLWGMAGWAADWFLRGLEWASNSPWALMETAPPSVVSTVLGTALAARAVCPGRARWRLCAAVGLGLWFYAR